jgi:hypothetical protein
MKINKTYDWVKQTGQGILDEGGDIQDIVLKKCPYYYMLEAVMANCPGMDPLDLFQAGLMEYDGHHEHNNIANGNSDKDTAGTSTSAQFEREESVQVVDKSPKKSGVNQQSNKRQKKDTISDLTDATANERSNPFC